MIQNSMLYTQRMPSGAGFGLPTFSFQRLPGVEQPSFDSPPVMPPSYQEACSPSAETGRLHRLADKIGALAARVEASGLTTVLIGLAATLPGGFATVGRVVVHTTQTAETYHRVRQAGFEGAQALAETAWWALIGR